MDGKDVLKQGLIRRIGTGEDTLVWHMNWLPRDGLMRSVSCLSSTPLVTVSELIDPVAMAWDQEILKQQFLLMDWEVILNIPLTTRR